MAENNRNQEQNPASPSKQTPGNDQENQKQNTSGPTEDQNPQHGTKWSNYQTRELSDEGYEDENTSGKESA